MRRVIIISVVLAAAILGWLYWQQHQPVPFVVSGFIEADQIRVGSRVGGRVAEVIAEEGDRLAKGAPLYRIDPFDLKEQLAEAEASLAAYRAELQRLKAGYRAEEIEQARARRDQAAAILSKLEAGPRQREIEITREKLNAAKANVELAESEFERLTKLSEERQAASLELERATRQVKSARADAAAAEQELALLQEGTRKEEIAQARAALAEAEQGFKLAQAGYRAEDVAKAAAQVQAAEAQVAAIKVRLSELTVVAPSDCQVEAIDLRPGDLVAPNAPSVTVLDLARMWVRAYVPEGRLGEVRLGERVPIRVDSFPNELFASRVTFISQDAEFTPRNIQTPEERSKQVFRIKATLEDGRDRLRVGMIADVLLDKGTASEKPKADAEVRK